MDQEFHECLHDCLYYCLPLLLALTACAWPTFSRSTGAVPPSILANRACRSAMDIMMVQRNNAAGTDKAPNVRACQRTQQSRSAATALLAFALAQTADGGSPDGADTINNMAVYVRHIVEVECSVSAPPVYHIRA